MPSFASVSFHASPPSIDIKWICDLASALPRAEMKLMNLPSGENCAWLSPFSPKVIWRAGALPSVATFQTLRARFHFVLFVHPLPHAVDHPLAIG